MPRLVYMNLSTLSTLEPRQYYSGFAEAMKSALISDARYYEWLVANLYEICDREPDAMEEMVCLLYTSSGQRFGFWTAA